MFHHMDGVRWALPKMKTKQKEDWIRTVKFAQHMLSKYHAKVTPMRGIIPISAQIPDPFQMLWSFRKWQKEMHTNPEDETSFTHQYQEAFPKYLENEYCTKYWCLPIIKPECILCNNPIPCTKASGSGQSAFDPYDLSGHEEEYLTVKQVAESTLGRSDHTVFWLTAPRLYFNSLPESPKYLGKVNLNINDYNYNPMAISSTLWPLDITDWWR